MITEKQVSDGIKSGAIRFITDPNFGKGTVCAIGEYWFNFGGETVENESPSEYLKSVPIEDIVSEVLSALNGFLADRETFGDEYDYYEAYLKEAAMKNEDKEKASGRTVRKYILIEYVEPEINTPEVFDTYEEAYEEMKSRYLDTTTDDTEDLERDVENGDAGLGLWSAFCQTTNHDNASWRIYEVDIAV